ncbi:MAG: ATP-binding protein [Elusimicrobia bacterium]|nr:ATP-binding protein [Elusimicrobiota bacterium]
MTTFKRYFDLKDRLAKNNFFLFGPRGTGKSFWIKKTLAGVRLFDLLDSDVYDRLARRPRQLCEEIPPGEDCAVIDEIQKIPRLLDEVHRLIEERGIRFLLTGSSARKLRRGGANMLGGRAWETSFYPLTWAEIPEFDLLKYVNRGGLPKVYLSRFPEEDLRAYTRLYINEEVKAEALTRNIENFVRFLDVLALSNGREINYHDLASDAGVPPRTIENYISVIKATLMGFELVPFLATKTRKAITRSKFYFFDIGVVNHITKRTPVSAGNPAFGDAFEHFIAMETRAFLGLTGKDAPLQFWRTKNGFEVDLIIGRELAVEVKAAKQVTERHLKGLKALKEEGLVRNYALVSLDPVTRDLAPGIKAYFWQDFLRLLWKGLLLP